MGKGAGAESAGTDKQHFKEEGRQIRFAMLFGPQITDSRLGDGEFRLLTWLQFRCRNEGTVWASNKTMSQDLGISERTVESRLSSLKKLGWISTEFRGVGRPSSKIVKPAEDVYGTGFIRDIFTFTRRDRTESDLAFLRSEPPPSSLDNAAETRSAESCGTGNLDNADKTRSADFFGIDPQDSSGSVPQDLAAKVEKEEVEKDQVDEADDASHHLSLSGTIKQDLDSVGTNPFGEESEEPPNEDEARATEARRIADEAAARSAETRERRAQRRDKRRTDKLLHGGGVSEEEAQGSVLDAMTAERKGTAYDVRDLYIRQMQEHFPDVRFRSWRKKELGQAKLLLKDFDLDLIRKMISFSFNNWPKYQKKFDLGGPPTIGWILAMGDTLSGEVQADKVAKASRGGVAIQSEKKFGW